MLYLSRPFRAQCSQPVAHCKKKVQWPTPQSFSFKKKYYISDSKRNVMSSVILNIKEEKISRFSFCNALTYIVITPPSWLKPAVNNRQQTTGNTLRICELSLKKCNSEYNFNKSYLTKFHKVCFHALRWCITLPLVYIIFKTI